MLHKLSRKTPSTLKSQPRWATQKQLRAWCQTPESCRLDFHSEPCTRSSDTTFAKRAIQKNTGLVTKVSKHLRKFEQIDLVGLVGRKLARTHEHIHDCDWANEKLARNDEFMTVLWNQHNVCSIRSMKSKVSWKSGLDWNKFVKNLLQMPLFEFILSVKTIGKS